MEAQLYESRESLNDTYYDHAKDAQNEALDAEQEAYETAMTKMVENMRVSLEEATADMASFLDSVTIAVSMNADTVLQKYIDTEVPLNDAITNPWEEAAARVGEYGNKATNLMDVWKKDGYFAEFSSTAGTNLSSPWSAGADAANAFKSSVDTAMDDVVTKIETNVQSAATKLSNLYQQIIDTENKAKSANVDVGDLGNGDNSTGYTYTGQPAVTSNPITATQPHATIRPAVPTRPTFKKHANNTGLNIGSKKYSESQYNSLEVEGSDGIYFPYTANGHSGKYVKKGEGYSVERNGGEYKIDFHSWKPLYTKYAKGTTGTPGDEWAITDEPQFGDELTMYATPDGTLSFMRAGSTVIPADLTRELIDLPKVVDGLINRPKFDSGINMIANAINKPEIVIDVENFLKVDRVDKDSLPQLEAMMDKKIDTFAKQLNYSIKRFAR